MNPENIDKLKELLAPVAEKIGQTAEWGWEVVLRQQIAYGIIYAFMAVFGIIGLCFVPRLWRWAIKTDHEGIEYLPPILLFFLSVAAIIGGTIDAILRLLNPSFYAIHFFVGLVK